MIEEIKELEKSQKSIEKVLAQCRKEVVANPEKYGVRIITWDDDTTRADWHRPHRWTCCVRIDAPPCPLTKAGGEFVSTEYSKHGENEEWSAVSNFMEQHSILMW